jgi:hypothetical protein
MSSKDKSLDNSTNYMYLINPNLLNKFKNKKEKTNILNNEIQFYRKRIFSLTKDYLKGKKRDKDLDKIWEIYANHCVNYFKFNDKSELLQETYKGMSIKKKKLPFDKKAIERGNEIILNKKKPPAPRITDHIKIKTTTTKTNKKMVIPRERNLNLKSEHFKNKI